MGRRTMITSINAEESFERLYQEEQKLAHGFVNSAVGTGHLNEAGHMAVADAACSDNANSEFAHDEISFVGYIFDRDNVT